MKKTLPVVMLFAAAILVAYTVAVRSVRALHAPEQVRECAVPKSAGSAKLITLNLLGFEDGDGTIRFINLDNCGIELIVTRL